MGLLQNEMSWNLPKNVIGSNVLLTITKIKNGNNNLVVQSSFISDALVYIMVLTFHIYSKVLRLTPYISLMEFPSKLFDDANIHL